MLKKKTVLALMAAHMVAFTNNTAAFGVYEKREEPTLGSISEAITGINTAFEEYKKTNDARIEAIKKGESTADLDAKLAKIDKDLNAMQEMKSKLEAVETKLSRQSTFEGSGRQDGEMKEDAEYRTAFFDWIRDPKNHKKQQKAQEAGAALQTKRVEIGLEKRETQATSTIGSAGGFALPKVVEQQILRVGVDASPMRQLATVRTVGTTDYKELVDVGGSTFEWVGETDTRNKTDTSSLREVAPTFGMASAKPQATEESLDDLFFNVEDWLIDSAREAIMEGEGAAFVTGNGTKKPTGFLAGPTPLVTGDKTRAFGTLQFLAGGAAAALPADFDKYYDMIYALRSRYRANASWLGSKAVFAEMRKVKNANDDYMWQPSAAAGQPDRFGGYPVFEDENMPAVAANAFPLALGDFKQGYLITDLVGLRVTRDEITAPGFVKFYVRKRVGGILRNTQAIKLLKIAA